MSQRLHCRWLLHSTMRRHPRAATVSGAKRRQRESTYGADAWKRHQREGQKRAHGCVSVVMVCLGREDVGVGAVTFSRARHSRHGLALVRAAYLRSAFIPNIYVSAGYLRIDSRASRNPDLSVVHSFIDGYHVFLDYHRCNKPPLAHSPPPIRKQDTQSPTTASP